MTSYVDLEYKTLFHYSFSFAFINSTKVSYHFDPPCVYIYIYICIYIYINLLGFCRTVWHLCRMGYRSMAEQIRGRKAPSLVGPPSGGRAANFLSSSNNIPAYVPGSKFGFVKLLASIDPCYT